MKLEETITVGGIAMSIASPPAGLAVRPPLGLLTSIHVDGQVVHRARSSQGGLYETRATITPGGDYLLMFPDGGHYAGKKTKVNDMLAYRSRDKGRTWQGPSIAFDIDYNQHGFVPLIPFGGKPRTESVRGKRLYAFGTQPVWDRFSCERGQQENAPIGFRWSDDDGHTWSKVKLIEPENDPGFKGMSVMRMCETDSGAWLIGSHEGDWSRKPLMTRQYVLRSEDQGATWTVAPRPRHDGWYVPGLDRMDEGRPVNLGGGRILLMTRTPEGHLWAARSRDDGRTWSDPSPTPLVHPDAPPMLFHLSDGRTLVAFHHNRFSDRHYTGLSDKQEVMKDRSEIWVSTSSDGGGETWTEPRFVFANAFAPSFESSWRNYQCSYLDMFVDGGVLNIFVPHRWHQVLHLTLKEDRLTSLPTRAMLV